MSQSKNINFGIRSTQLSLKMDSCGNVEKELDKVFNKFGAFKEHLNRTLTELIEQVDSLQCEFIQSRFTQKLHLLLFYIGIHEIK